MQASAKLGWPSEALLLGCGAEFLPVTRQDDADDLRMMMGSSGRIVRIRDRVYGEGDIVANTLLRKGQLKRS